VKAAVGQHLFDGGNNEGSSGLSVTVYVRINANLVRTKDPDVAAINFQLNHLDNTMTYV
jgi:hypothetical protein